MSVLSIAELEEELDNLFPNGYAIETDKYGQIVIFTGLKEDENEELVIFDSEEDPDADHDDLDDEDDDDD